MFSIYSKKSLLLLAALRFKSIALHFSMAEVVSFFPASFGSVEVVSFLRGQQIFD